MADKEKSGDVEKPAKKRSWITYLVIAVALLLLLGGGAAGYFFFMKESPAPAPSAPAAGGKIGPDGQLKPLVGPMVNIDPFIVNILDEQGTHYLKAAITLEMDNQLVLEEVNQRMPQLRDAILLLVGNKTFRDLADLQGKLQLRAELLSEINKILKTGEVKKIYFTDFVVQ